jgi:hypothetical protein
MRDAAGDVEAGGVVAELFDGVPVAPGSVPQLRLLAALHRLVLAGDAPELARFYPSAGGDLSGSDVWPVAQAALRAHFDAIKASLGRTVQTNDPGRSVVLFSALLWLTDRYQRPIRLLEFGAGAGLNLLADRYCYVSGDLELGQISSCVRFIDPWSPPPAIDLGAAARALRITAREGCDLAPLDPRSAAAQLTVLSYIWPDEPDRMARTKAALEVATREPAIVATQDATAWLPAALARRLDDEVTVVWHSLVRQYVQQEHWQALESAFRRAVQQHPRAPLVWLSMEPGADHLTGMRLTARTAPDEPELLLATCHDHGPPTSWQNPLPPA